MSFLTDISGKSRHSRGKNFLDAITLLVSFLKSLQHKRLHFENACSDHLVRIRNEKRRKDSHAFDYSTSRRDGGRETSNNKQWMVKPAFAKRDKKTTIIDLRGVLTN
jgi:hypothetical protein